MYMKARNESEKELINKLKQFRFDDIYQGDSFDDVNHIDVIALKNNIKWHFDVKDLTRSNVYSENYSLSKHEVNDFHKYPEKYKYHCIACRKYLNRKPTGNFIMIRTIAIEKYVKLRDMTTFWLLPAYECLAKMPKNLCKEI